MKFKQIITAILIFLSGLAVGFHAGMVIGRLKAGEIEIQYIDIQNGRFCGKPVGEVMEFFKPGKCVEFMDVKFRVLSKRYTGPSTVTDLPYESELEITFPDGWSITIKVLYDGYTPVGFTRIYIVEHGDVKAGILIIEGVNTLLLVMRE